MVFPGTDFSGRVAVVTGGGTGIGAATAQLLARLGARVAIASRSAERLEKAAAEITAASKSQCIAIPTDVRDENEVSAMIEKVVAQFGRIDVLVNNAGGTRLAPLEDITTRMWDSSFSLNVDAAYYCTREAGKYFREQGSGSIVNVSSMAGVNGTRSGAHYSASKAALQMFTRVAAAEWGPYGIRINCVAPGLILSEMATEHLENSGIDIEAGIRAFPLQRAGNPDDVARAIVFLASDAAAYITGETLAVCGGPVLGGQKNE